MKERIQQLIDFYKLNPYAFSKKISVSEGTIRKFLAGQIGLKADTLTKILATFDEISPDWLILGKGEMLRSEAPKSAISPTESDKIWKEILADKDRRIEELIIENYQIREQVAHIQAITPPHHAMG
ncbi:MAG: helix-turn-helix transcriptional regulator [Bacteroidales bacterium]|nr:helix-turn-helix transcriptional regulator [Bacteroidales bacterium]